MCPKVLKLSSEMSECKPLVAGDQIHVHSHVQRALDGVRVVPDARAAGARRRRLHVGGRGGLMDSARHVVERMLNPCFLS